MTAFIDLDGVNGLRIIDCQFFGDQSLELANGTDIEVRGTRGGWSVVDDCKGVRFSQNYWAPVNTSTNEPVLTFSNRPTGTFQEGLIVDGDVLAGAISDGGGILIDDYDHAMIRNVRFDQLFEHHLQITDSDRVTVQGCTFNPEDDPGADDTWDLIFIDGTSSRCFVTANQLIPDGSAGNQNRYGVNLDGTGECNIVVGNDFGDPDDYATDAWNDAMSNTQQFWPADATYGDNFTDCGSGS